MGIKYILTVYIISIFFKVVEILGLWLIEIKVEQKHARKLIQKETSGE